MRRSSITGFPDYEIFENGQVLSLPRFGVSGRFLKPRTRPDGYIQVTLTKDGKGYQKLLHCLLAEAFLGDRPKGQDVNHINGYKDDNRVENLEYCTRSENCKHAERLGLVPRCRGDKHHKSRLKADQVHAICRELLNTTRPQTEIAKEYGVGNNVISNIMRGVSWKHISQTYWTGALKGRRYTQSEWT